MLIGLVLCAAMLSLTLLAVSAQAGSGGVGTGGGGGGDRTSNGDRYDRMWDNFSRKDKKWAHRTSRCESGDRPKAHDPSGKYHGAFQFMKSTWKSSPKSPGDVACKFDWRTQAVVAVKLKQRDGADHWPNCG